MNGSSIFYPKGAKFDSSKQAVVDIDGNTAMQVQIRSANDNVTPKAGQLAIDEKNFPESRFRNYVANNLDPDKDGYLSQEELDAVNTINVSGTTFAFNGYGLKGIEHFTNLLYLNCENCMLSGLD